LGRPPRISPRACCRSGIRRSGQRTVSARLSLGRHEPPLHSRSTSTRSIWAVSSQKFTANPQRLASLADRSVR
jgi:hypothetical protein